MNSMSTPATPGWASSMGNLRSGDRRDEEQLHYYASLTQCMSDAVISTDTRFTIVSWNAAAETLYGWKQEEVLGKSIFEIIPTTYPFGETAPDLQAYLFSHRSWKGEVIQQRRDGLSLFILSSVSVVT